MLCSNFILECPYGWIDAKHVNLGCLLLKKEKPMSWNDAKLYCETQEYENSHLVEIYDSAQQRFLKEMLLQFDNSLVWWIGLTDSEVEGIWKWDYSGDIATYYSWDMNEPDGGGIENCVSLWSKEYAWRDIPCSWDDKYYPICQFDY